MVGITCGPQRLEIPASELVDAILAGMPAGLADGQGLDGKAALMRTVLKALVPMVLAALADEAQKRGIPPPDLKSPECRRNNIAYALRYVLGIAASAMESREWAADGEDSNGTYRVTGFRAAAAVAQEPASHTAAERAPVAVG